MVAVSAHLKLALAWIGFLNTKDPKGMDSILSDNFQWVGRPVTLGFPPMGKQAYISALGTAPFKYFNASPGYLSASHTS
jgi:hypothetical protein